MNTGETLYQAAVTLAVTRYPTGWAGAAAIRTESGQIFTSIAPDIKNDALSLCMEVGAYLEAHKFNDAVTHSLCVARESDDSDFLILTPCGICQERLIHWGWEVKAAISNPDNAIEFKLLPELQPHHWSKVYAKETD